MDTANAIFLPNTDTSDNTSTFTFSSHENANNNGEADMLAPHARRPPGSPRVRRIRSGVEGPFGKKRGMLRLLVTQLFSRHFLRRDLIIWSKFRGNYICRDYMLE
jgi:hypothetical protein